ncbi:hypothetical protein D3C87_587020 [compost metagenome]
MSAKTKRSATRDLRESLVRMVLDQMLSEGNTPITIVEVSRRTEIPRSTLSNTHEWRQMILEAETQRLRKRTERLMQMREDFNKTELRRTPLFQLESPQGIVQDGLYVPAVGAVSFEGILSDLQALAEQCMRELQDAYHTGLRDGMERGSGGKTVEEEPATSAEPAVVGVPLEEHERLIKEAYAKGRDSGLQESRADLMQAYERGRQDGIDEGRRQGNSGGGFGWTINRGQDKDWALAVLHAARTTPSDQLRQAYRLLTKAFHTDRNPDMPPEYIRNLNRAKEILGI